MGLVLNPSSMHSHCAIFRKITQPAWVSDPSYVKWNNGHSNNNNTYFPRLLYRVEIMQVRDLAQSLVYSKCSLSGNYCNDCYYHYFGGQSEWEKMSWWWFLFRSSFLTLGNRIICPHLFSVNWENVLSRRIFNVLRPNNVGGRKPEELHFYVRFQDVNSKDSNGWLLTIHVFLCHMGNQNHLENSHLGT